MVSRIRPNDEVVQLNLKKWGIPQPEREYTVLIHCTTYNHGKYIKDALEGFVMQKCSFPFCAIVIDDCSTDNNSYIIREYAEKYPDIIKPILLGENHMQRGILRDPYFEKWHKSAKYLAFCEGDDYWIDPLKLQRQFDYLEAHPDCSMVFHNAFQLNINDKGRSAQLFNDFDRDQDLTMYDAVNKWLVPTASIMFKREYIVFPTWIPPLYSSDLTMILLFMDYGRVHYLNTISSVYRRVVKKDSHSMTSTVSGLNVMKQHLALFESYNKGTNFRYNEIVQERINYLKKEIAFHEAKQSKQYWRFLGMLPLILKKAFRNIKERL